MLTLVMLLADTSLRAIAVPVAPAETLYVMEAGSGDAVVLVPGLFGSAFAYRQVAPLLVAAGRRAIVIEPLEGGIAESATTPGFRRAMRFAPLLRLFGGMGAIRGSIRKQLLAASADTGWVTDQVVLGYTAGAARDLGATLRAFGAMGRSVEPDSLAPRLREVRCPVLLLLGGAPHEGGPPTTETALLADGIPWLVSDALPGVGHFIHEEAPAQVAAAVDRMRVTITVLGPLFHP